MINKKSLIFLTLIPFSLYATCCNDYYYDDSSSTDTTVTTTPVGDSLISTPIESEFETIENPDGSYVIETTPTTLDSGYLSQTKIDVTKEGEIKSSIKISDEAGETKAETTLEAPSETYVQVLQDGSINTSYTTNNRASQINAQNTGEVTGVIETLEEAKMEFAVPAGSDSLILKDGTLASHNSLTFDSSSVNTKIKANQDGDLIATATMIDTSNSRKIKSTLNIATFTARREFSDIKVELILADTTKFRAKLGESKFLATYTARRRFSFREVDIVGESIEIIPQTQYIKIEESHYFDGKVTLKLISGRADLIVDENRTSLESEVEYNLPSYQSTLSDEVDIFEDGKLTLSKGWNLISIPTQSESVATTKLGSQKVWIYDYGWKEVESLSSGVGFWLNSSSDNEIAFEGESYTPNLKELSSGWHLLGTGEILDYVKSRNQFEMVYTYQDKWLKNPDNIYEGQGFWVLVK